MEEKWGNKEIYTRKDRNIRDGGINMRGEDHGEPHRKKWEDRRGKGERNKFEPLTRRED